MVSKRTIAELSHVTFAYNGEAALQDVSLTVHEGDFIAMIGPNGGGKTTLLKLILGLLKPTHGHVLLEGKEAAKKPAPHQMDLVERLIDHLDRIHRRV